MIDRLTYAVAQVQKNHKAEHTSCHGAHFVFKNMVGLFSLTEKLKSCPHIELKTEYELPAHVTALLYLVFSETNPAKVVIIMYSLTQLKGVQQRCTLPKKKGH